MSEKLLPIPDKFDKRNVQGAFSDGGFGDPMQLRRSSRSKLANKRRDLEGKTAERARVSIGFTPFHFQPSNIKRKFDLQYHWYTMNKFKHTTHIYICQIHEANYRCNPKDVN